MSNESGRKLRVVIEIDLDKSAILDDDGHEVQYLDHAIDRYAEKYARTMFCNSEEANKLSKLLYRKKIAKLRAELNG